MAERRKLKAVKVADPLDITAQLRKKFTSPDPEIQARKSISPAEAIGGAELGYYKGHTAGIFDAYLTLKKSYPFAAKELLRAFSMKDVGGEWVIH